MHLLVFALGLVVACAPAARGVRLDDPPRAAVSDDLAHEDRTLESTRATLYVQHWHPKSGDAKAVVILHHGLADHSARYAMLVERLVRAGYSVWAHDMRGHARSSGRRVTFDRIDELVGDLDRVVALAREAEPGKPMFLFGHSLGGLVTALYAIERQPAVAGVVLSAPGIAFDLPAFAIGAVRFTTALAPNAPLLDTPHRDFSTSPAVVADMGKDPLIESPKGPARSSRAALDGLARIWAHPERLDVPLFAVHGTGDKIVAPIASRELVARAGNADRTLRLYDDLAHDLLHEPDGGGERVATDIVAWLDAHVANAPAPFATAPRRTLRGDRRAMAIQVDLDARGERADGDITGVTGGLRLRLGIGRIGYAAGLDLRAGSFDTTYLSADLHAAGLGVRAAGGATVALTGGIGAARIAGTTRKRMPVELALELPLGPLHVLARGGLAFDLADFGADPERAALVGLRLGRDRAYWPGTRAGAGPFLGVTYQRIGTPPTGAGDVWGVALGGQLWGGN